MQIAYNLTQCMTNTTNFDQISCLSSQAPNLYTDLIVFGFMIFLWFIFGIAIKVGKKELLIGQGNYWLFFLIIVIGILLKIFLEYFPIWNMWI